LVLGSNINDPNTLPMTIYLNEIVSKNTTVSNNIIVVSNDNEAAKVKNTMESSNNSLVSSPHGLNETKFTAQSSKHQNESAKSNYLTSKNRIIEK